MTTTRPSPQDQPGQPEQAARRPRRRGLLRRTALAAAALAAASGLMLAVPGIASATVDQTSPQWAELGPWAYTGDQSSQVTAVYTIQNVAESGTEMLEDRGNSMANGGTVDVWTRYNQTTAQDPMNTSAPKITQANYLWEFVPFSPSAGGSITDGPGELINRQSGLCLDVAASNQGDGAAIDQWGCNGGTNQQWAVQSVNGHYQIAPVLDLFTGFLGVGNGGTCTTSGDGDGVYVRTTGTSNNPCDEWDIQQASYDFATHEITTPRSTPATDNRGYECITGDTLRVSPWWTPKDEVDDAWDNANIGQAPQELGYYTSNPAPPNYVPNGTLQYWTNYNQGPLQRAHHHIRLRFHPGSHYVRAGSHHVPKPSAGPDEQTAQVMLYCDPPTTTP